MTIDKEKCNRDIKTYGDVQHREFYLNERN